MTRPWATALAVFALAAGCVAPSEPGDDVPTSIFDDETPTSASRSEESVTSSAAATPGAPPVAVTFAINDSQCGNTGETPCHLFASARATFAEYYRRNHLHLYPGAATSGGKDVGAPISAGDVSLAIDAAQTVATSGAGSARSTLAVRFDPAARVLTSTADLDASVACGAQGDYSRAFWASAGAHDVILGLVLVFDNPHPDQRPVEVRVESNASGHAVNAKWAPNTVLYATEADGTSHTTATDKHPVQSSGETRTWSASWTANLRANPGRSHVYLGTFFPSIENTNQSPCPAQAAMHHELRVAILSS